MVVVSSQMFDAVVVVDVDDKINKISALLKLNRGKKMKRNDQFDNELNKPWQLWHCPMAHPCFFFHFIQACSRVSIE